MRTMFAPQSKWKSSLEYAPIKEERPHRGYRIQRCIVRNSIGAKFEVFFCECVGKRTVLASTLALAKRAIDAREGILKEGNQ